MVSKYSIKSIIISILLLIIAFKILTGVLKLIISGVFLIIIIAIIYNLFCKK